MHQLRMIPAKFILSAFALFAISACAFAQPAIQWQRTLGGTSSDQAYALLQTSDGGFLVTGWSSSNDFDFTDHHGPTTTRDGIAIKFDSLGNVQWKHSYGGSDQEIFPCFALAHGGGYILAGSAASTDGDLLTNRGAAGTTDCWVVKIDTSGNIVWSKTYGGTGNDAISRIIATDDGGYLFAASTTSNDGEVHGNHASGSATSDYWLVKIDGNGASRWSHCFGGSGNDSPFGLAITPDHCYVLCGNSESSDGDVADTRSGHGNWVVKVDTLGKILWEHTFGNLTGQTDNNTVTVATDGGYIIGGSAYVAGGDVPNHYGHPDEYDIWVFKVSPAGNLVWSNIYGGNGRDYEQDVHATDDGGFLISGYSTSNDIDVTGHHGDTTNYDAWVVKCDSLGAIEWEQSYGGSQMEGASGIISTSDGGIAIAANTRSTDGDLSHDILRGGEDAWIFKLSLAATNSDSMSIPYFPLHVGDKWSYSIKTSPYGSSGITYPTTYATITCRDTIIQNTHYRSAPLFVGFRSNDATIDWYRTNGKDSIWVNTILDGIASDKLFATFHNAAVGQSDTSWFDDYMCRTSVTAVALSPSHFDLDSTSKITYLSYSPDFTDQTRLFDSRYGLLSITNDVSEQSESTDYILIGGILAEKEYGVQVSVASASQKQLIPNSQLLISPNPFDESAANTMFIETANNISSVTITDVLGTTVKSIAMQSPATKVRITTTDLQAGIYFIQAKGGGNSAMGRVVILR